MAVEVGDNQIGGGERGVVDAAGLDDDERLGAGAVDAAGVAEGVGSEAAAGNFAVGVEDFFAERGEEHGVQFTVVSGQLSVVRGRRASERCSALYGCILL